MVRPEGTASSIGSGCSSTTDHFQRNVVTCERKGGDASASPPLRSNRPVVTDHLRLCPNLRNNAAEVSQGFLPEFCEEEQRNHKAADQVCQGIEPESQFGADRNGAVQSMAVCRSRGSGQEISQTTVSRNHTWKRVMPVHVGSLPRSRQTLDSSVQIAHCQLRSSWL